MANKWRISGGIGIPPEDPHAQNMTQGLGFPLRPVDNVQPTNSEIYDDIEVAEGLFMQFMPDGFIQGKLYPKGSCLNAGDGLMCALTHTFDDANPTLIGSPTWALSDTPAFGDQSNNSVIYSGHEYVFDVPGMITGLRIYVPELSSTTHYRVTIIDITDPNNILTSTINDPLLTEDDWRQISYTNKLVAAGTKYLIYIDALNSGNDSIVTGGWTYGGSSGNVPVPPVGGWTRNNTNLFIRVSNSDLDGTDRSAELDGMIPGTEVTFAQTNDTNKAFRYRIEGDAVPGASDTQFPVVLLNLGPLGGVDVGAVSTMTATVPIPQATLYSEMANNPNPSWGTVTPFLAYDGVDQGATNTSFGVDVEFQEAEFSPDWAIMAITQV